MDNVNINFIMIILQCDLNISCVRLRWKAKEELYKNIYGEYKSCWFSRYILVEISCILGLNVTSSPPYDRCVFSK